MITLVQNIYCSDYVQLVNLPLLNNFSKNFDLSEKKTQDTLKEIRGNQKVTTRTPENSFRALKKYGIDLVEQAKSGKLGSCYWQRFRNSACYSNSIQKDQK